MNAEVDNKPPTEAGDSEDRQGTEPRPPDGGRSRPGEPQEPQSTSGGSLLSVPNPKGFIEKLPVAGFVWTLYRSYGRRNGPLLSAGIAYYALFSMGPLLLLTLQLTGRLFGKGPPPALDRLTATLEQYLGHEMAATIATIVTSVKGPSGYTFAIVGLGILLYGATRLFVRLQVSFNIMWDVRIVSRGLSTRRLLSRLLVFAMILVPTVLLVVAVVLGTAFTWLAHLVGDSGILVQIAQVVLPFLIGWIALLVIFVVLPDVELSWRDCWFSTLLIAIAWTVATRVFGSYLKWSGSTKYAGAVGALVGVIFWVDIMAIITLVGVRFNRAIYLWRGKVVRPNYYAALVTELPEGERQGAETPEA